MHSSGAAPPSTWNGGRGRGPGSRAKRTRPGGRAQVVGRVGRPTAAEHEYFQGQTLVSFLHLAVASPDLRAALQQGEMTVITCETIHAGAGSFPVLHPTSEVAGRLAPIIAGSLLETMLPHGADADAGGRGLLLRGIPAPPPPSARGGAFSPTASPTPPRGWPAPPAMPSATPSCRTSRRLPTWASMRPSGPPPRYAAASPCTAADRRTRRSPDEHRHALPQPGHHGGRSGRGRRTGDAPLPDRQLLRPPDAARRSGTMRLVPAC